jgi:hypothetical protein
VVVIPKPIKIVIEYVCCAVCGVGVPESVTVTTTLEAVPAADGVPLITPAEDMVRPAGKPVAVNVYGAVPPVAVTVAV